MAFSVNVRIVDVLDIPIATPALLSVEWISAASGPGEIAFDTTGFVLPVPDDWTRVTLSVDHVDYDTLSVTLKLDGANAILWNNRGCQLKQSGTSVDLTLVVCRVRQSPIVAPPWGDHGQGDQAGIFYSGTTAKQYAGIASAFLPVSSLHMLRDQPSKKTPGVVTVLADPNTDGWDRFNSVTTSSTLEGNGGFIWLEYGSLNNQQQPRFIVAVWTPKFEPPPPRAGLDYVVFFSPSTLVPAYPRSAFPFRRGYPYTVLPVNTVIQPYVTLAYRYFFIGGWLVPMALASGKPAITVMPIFPAVPDNAPMDMWQPFNSQSGLHRLLLEVGQFLHQFGYGRVGSDFRNWQGASARADGMPAPLPEAWYAISEQRPAIRNLTLCGYSGGVQGLLPIITRERIADMRYPSALFGGDPQKFVDAWRELWDLDFDLNEKLTGISVLAYQNAVASWVRAGHDRRLRLYHSGYTTNDTRPTAVLSSLATSSKVVETADGSDASVWAEEWRDVNGHWSVLFTSKNYLRARVEPPGVPAFPLLSRELSDIHLFASLLGFGHASRLRFA